MTEAERAYIAGIIDGEGHISLSKRTRGYVPIVAITGTYLPMLEWVQERIGGNLYRKSLPSKDGKNKSHFQLVLTKQAIVAALLDEIEPYLIIKKAHVPHIRNFLNRRKYEHHSATTQEAFLALKRLNARGLSNHQLELC